MNLSITTQQNGLAFPFTLTRIHLKMTAARILCLVPNASIKFDSKIIKLPEIHHQNCKLQSDIHPQRCTFYKENK